MTRYGAMYGPDVTFLGVARCDLDDRRRTPTRTWTSSAPPSTAAPRTGRGPVRSQAWTADYLPQDGSRPSLALRTDGLTGSTTPGTWRCSPEPGPRLAALEAALEQVAPERGVPVSLGGDHSIAFPDARGCANVVGAGRVSMVHFDAHADTGTSATARCGGTGSRCGG